MKERLRNKGDKKDLVSLKIFIIFHFVPVPCLHRIRQ